MCHILLLFSQLDKEWKVKILFVKITSEIEFFKNMY